MRKLYFFVFIIFFQSAFSQDISTDSKGDFLFGIPTINIQTELSSNNIGLYVPVRVRRKDYYVSLDTGDDLYTMVKAKIWYLKGNVVNNTKSTLIFNKKTNYSPSLELGYSIGFDTLFAPSGTSETYFTKSIAIKADYQNFKYYDKATQTFVPNKTNRISPGIKANITLFKGTTWAASLSGGFTKSIVTDELTSYQNMSNTFYADNNVAANGQNDGYFTPAPITKNVRISLAVPQFWISGNQGKIPFFLTPYYYILHKIDISTVHNAGLILTFIPKKFRKFDRSIDGSISKSSVFQFSKALNIGYNALSNSKKDPRYIFISGTFSLGSISGKKL